MSAPRVGIDSGITMNKFAMRGKRARYRARHLRRVVRMFPGVDLSVDGVELDAISLVKSNEYVTGFVVDSKGKNQAEFERLHGLKPGSMDIKKVNEWGPDGKDL